MLAKADRRIYLTVWCTFLLCLLPGWGLFHVATVIQEDIQLDEGHLETTCTVMKFSRFESCCTQKATISKMTIIPGDGFQAGEYESCVPDGYYTHCFVTADGCSEAHLSPKHFDQPPCLPHTTKVGDSFQCHAACAAKTFTLEPEEANYHGLMLLFFGCALAMLVITFSGSYLVMYFSHQDHLNRGYEQKNFPRSLKAPLSLPSETLPSPTLVRRRDPSNRILGGSEICLPGPSYFQTRVGELSAPSIMGGESLISQSASMSATPSISVASDVTPSIGGSVISQRSILSWITRHNTRSSFGSNDLSMGGTAMDDLTTEGMRSETRSVISCLSERSIYSVSNTCKKDPTKPPNHKNSSNRIEVGRKRRVTWSVDEEEAITPSKRSRHVYFKEPEYIEPPLDARSQTGRRASIDHTVAVYEPTEHRKSDWQFDANTEQSTKRPPPPKDPPPPRKSRLSIRWDDTIERTAYFDPYASFGISQPDDTYRIVDPYGWELDSSESMASESGWVPEFNNNPVPPFQVPSSPRATTSNTSRPPTLRILKARRSDIPEPPRCYE